MPKKVKKRTGRYVSKTLESIKKEEMGIELEEKKIEKAEENIINLVKVKPLSGITVKDVNKGVIGAFVGVVAHFGFIYGKEIAEKISPTRATLLYLFSYSLIIILMYETGYRKIKEKRIMKVLPLRATVIFLISIIVILFIFLLFDQIDFSNIGMLYSEVAVTSVLAVLGASTADLIGR